MRKSELVALTTDAVVQIGSAYWLRIPVAKLHNDRYIPLHPQLKELLDSWLDSRPDGLRSKLMFIERGRPMSTARVDAAVDRVARAAGLDNVSPHRLDDAIARLHRVANGLPRMLINAATAALIAAASENKDLVDDACAKKAVAELTRD